MSIVSSLDEAILAHPGKTFLPLAEYRALELERDKEFITAIETKKKPWWKFWGSK